MWQSWKPYLLGWLCIGVYTVQAQDPEFSQFYNAPIYMNPALAGTGQCGRAIINYREQWPGVQDPYISSSRTYTTYAASFDQYFDAIGGSVGVQFLGDHAGGGTVSTHLLGAMYAYRIRFEALTVQAAVQATVYQKAIDWGALVFEDQLDPRYGLTGNVSADHQGARNSVFYPDFTTGVFAYSKQLYGGVAVRHLSQPDQSLTQGGSVKSILPMRMTAHAGGIIYLQEAYERNVFLAPDILYTHQREFKQLNLGLHWSNEMLIAGVWWRFAMGDNISDAIIPKVGFAKDFFRIAYSYDFTISAFREGVGQMNAGAHELAVMLNFCPKEQKTTPEFCPRFF